MTAKPLQQKSHNAVRPSRSLAPPLATAELLKEMYARMLRARTLHSLNGAFESTPSRRKLTSEGVTVGVGIELKPGDTLCADRQHLLQYLASVTQSPQADAWKVLQNPSVDLPLRLHETGSSIVSPDSEGHAQIAVGIGVAHAFRTLGQPYVCVILPGRFGNSLLFAYDAMELATRQKLPLVFVFEEPLEKDGAHHHRAAKLCPELLGIPQIPVDGNDSIAVHRVATEAIQRARQGGGATLIACQMATAELGARRLGLADDPIAHMEHYLLKHGLWSETWNVTLKKELHNLREVAAGSI